VAAPVWDFLPIDPTAEKSARFPMTEAIHPCLKCGVCCTNYRVEFSIYELQSMGGTVPDELAHEVPGKGNRARMNGTAQHPVRCVALGDLGNDCVGCTIYEQRSRPCRDFPFASYGCHDTRAKFDLPALTEAEVERWAEAA
jgi:Fe-S-cluster containining protein